ncbi:hypothetical protein DYI37_08760 [Fulvimarina endophytica]|uniref:Uncharacterized protein n=1 Tax=Fulvimarina endophytica TaxID=2293836 RepID=A0A371X5S3_9HYPH|nr:hypothetical protein DYI37_08760 [Fulvimarina endophytica]
MDWRILPENLPAWQTVY